MLKTILFNKPLLSIYRFFAYADTEKSSCDNNVRTFNYARFAFRNYCITRNIKTLFIPAYICKSLIEWVSDEIDVIFYPIDSSNLQPDFDKITINSNEDGVCLLVVNYFGLRIDEACKERLQSLYDNFKVNILIDDSHGGLNTLFIEKKFDYLYSVRKILPIGLGGFVLGRETECFALRVGEGGFKNFLYQFFIKNIAVLCKLGLFRNLNSDSVTDYKLSKLSRIRISLQEICMDSYSSRLLSKKYVLETVRRRKSISEMYKKHLHDFMADDALRYIPQNSLLSSLQAFPLYIAAARQRGIVTKLRNEGIGAYIWPDLELPKEEIIAQDEDIANKTVELQDNIVLLPVSEIMREREVKTVCNLLQSVLM